MCLFVGIKCINLSFTVFHRGSFSISIHISIFALVHVHTRVGLGMHCRVVCLYVCKHGIEFVG